MTRLIAALVALLVSCTILPELSLAACPGTFVDLGGKCYYFFDNSPQTFLSARQVCQNLGGDLAVLEDCNDLKLIAGYIGLSGVSVPEGYWVGGTDIIEDGVFQWIDGTAVPMGAPFWGRTADSPEEPSGGEAENCAYMATGEGFFFHDGDCNEPTGMAPLCQHEVAAGCPAPYVDIAGGCYQFLSALEETWEDARYICQASSGDLAVVDDCNTMAAIINYVNSNVTAPTNGFWIGATDVDIEGDWMWVNDGAMELGVPFWGSEGVGPLQPDDQFAIQNCLELWSRDRYYYNDVECDPTDGRAPLCETDPITI